VTWTFRVFLLARPRFFIHRRAASIALLPLPLLPPPVVGSGNRATLVGLAADALHGSCPRARGVVEGEKGKTEVDKERRSERKSEADGG